VTVAAAPAEPRADRPAAMPSGSSASATLSYVAPMAAFMLFLALAGAGRLGSTPVDFALRLVVPAAVVLLFSRQVVDLRSPHWRGSVLLGTAVFVLWIAPDLLWPGYRDTRLFQNPLTGRVGSSVPEAYRGSAVVLLMRGLRAVILVPIVEELFWRGWMMRWLVDSDFRKVRLGTVTLRAFVITALLFAVEHGAHWDVGLVAGVLYNWWMVRTRRLGDCILAHAITNGLLSGYVLLAGQWQYW
jgi:CAAX protease family protein